MAEFIGNTPVDKVFTWQLAYPERGPTWQDLANILGAIGYELGVQETSKDGYVSIVRVGRKAEK